MASESAVTAEVKSEGGAKHAKRRRRSRSREPAKHSQGQGRSQSHMQLPLSKEPRWVQVFRHPHQTSALAEPRRSLNPKP